MQHNYSSEALVFVSYDHEDRDRVAPVVKRLRRRRWEVWWDRETRIGAEWRNVIDDRLRHAGCVVVVWTRRSVKSRWVREEAERQQTEAFSYLRGSTRSSHRSDFARFSTPTSSVGRRSAAKS